MELPSADPGLLPGATRTGKAVHDRDPLELVERARSLVGQRVFDLALIEYGRALGSAAFGDTIWCEAANDVGVLHVQNGRPDLAFGFLDAAREAQPGRELYRSNFEAVRDLAPTGGQPTVRVDDPGGVASLGPWVREALAHCNELVPFQGRRVLEVGGALPGHAVAELRALTWTSVDPLATPLDEPRHRVVAAGAEDVPLEDGSVDLAFSCCAFEHVSDLPAVLAEIERLLAHGGALFAEFSPIWSSDVGHHVWLVEPGSRLPSLTFVDGVVPRWAHLLWEPEDLEAFVRPTHGPERARRAAQAVYTSAYLNRLFADDFEAAFAASGLAFERLEPAYATPAPSPSLQARLEAAHPGKRNFRPPGYRLLARKR